MTTHPESGEQLPFILRNTIELDLLFREMLLREPILSLAEAIVGPDCKFCGQNVLRNLPGLSISTWHVGRFGAFSCDRCDATSRPTLADACDVVYSSDGVDRYRFNCRGADTICSGEPLFR